MTLGLCKITTANAIQKLAQSGSALSIVQYVDNLGIFGSIPTEHYFGSKKKYSTALIVSVQSP